MADEKLLVAEIITLSTIISILFTTAVDLVIEKVLSEAGTKLHQPARRESISSF